MSLNTILATTPLTSTNYVLKATGTTIGNSLIFDNGTNVGIGNTNTSYTLDVSGTLRTTGNSILASTSGNVGIGITPYTWNSIFVGIDFVNKGGVNSYTNYLALSQNMYYGTGALDGWRYKTSGYGAGITLESDSGSIVFRNTSSSGTADAAASTYAERMRITSGGNVGIGTSSPAKLLDMVGDAYAGIGIYDGTNTAVMQWHASDGFRIVTATAKPIVFFTNNSERMRILSGGEVAINRTDGGGGRLAVRGATSGGGANAFYVDNSSSALLLSVRDDGALGTGTASSAPYNLIRSGRVMMVDSGGVVGYQSSTKESKTNINNLTNVSFLYQLNPVSFNYRKTEEISNTFTDEFNEDLHYGLIADEVEKVNKELVFYNEKDGVKELAGVEYGKLTAVLIKAIQELNDRLIKLESK